jgi:hypothetical protein
MRRTIPQSVSGPVRTAERKRFAFCCWMVLGALGLNIPAKALHQIAGRDFGAGDANGIELVRQPVEMRTTTSVASTSTAPASGPAVSSTSGRPAATQSGLQLTEAGWLVQQDGEWLLPQVDVPVGAEVVIEDLLWFRLEGEQFGRSRDWNGRVELVAFDAGGPRISVRCSSIRQDGTVEYHDGHEWRQTGAILRGDVSYLLRTVFRTDRGNAEVTLIEPGPTDSSEKGALEPLLSTGRQVQLVSGIHSGMLERGTVRRSFRVSGRPLFATVLRRWQLWNLTEAGQVLVPRGDSRAIVPLMAAGAVQVTGALRMRRLQPGQMAVSFEPQLGLLDDFRCQAGWSGQPEDRIVTEQGGPVLIVSGLGSLGCGADKRFLPPRVPFDLRIVFKLAVDAPPLRTIDLVRLIRKETRSPVGPWVQLLCGAHDLGNGKWAARLAAQVGQPQPVIDGNPVLPDTWYELAVKVDPVVGIYTVALTSLGKERPARLFRPATQPASLPSSPQPGPPAPAPVPVFGGQPQRFFGLSQLPHEMVIAFSAEGAYHPLGRPIELDARPTLVLPIPDNTKPWTNPATLSDMTYRDGRLEVLSAHGGASLLSINLADGAGELVEKAFGPRPGQSLAWDQWLNCYWLVQSEGKFLLERRRPDHRDVSPFSPGAATQPGGPPPVIPMLGNCRLAVNSKDLFCVTWDNVIFHLEGKKAPAKEFYYRKEWADPLRFAGVAADDETLLLAGPYGAPNAATILAVDLASGLPIRQFSLRRYIQGITSLANDSKRLYVLAANDRLVLSCDWPDRRALGLTSPVLMVGRIDMQPVNAADRLDLIGLAPTMPQWSGAISRTKDAQTGVESFTVQQASLRLNNPAVVTGATAGEFARMQASIRLAGPAQVLQVAFQPLPVGKPRSAYLAALDEKTASRWPLPQQRTTARQFFLGADFIRDEKSPLRQFKPANDDDLVVLLPAGQEWRDIRLDLCGDFALPAEQWVGQIELSAIGAPCQVGRLWLEAASAAQTGPAEGMLLGGVVDLDRAGYELADWQSDLTPADRPGEQQVLSVRSADDRTELGYQDWREVPRTTADATSGRSPATRASGLLARPATIRLGRYVQWRVELSTPYVHEPPMLAKVDLILIGESDRRAKAVAPPMPADTWRTWWPMIFAAPLACWLIWFAFLRRRRE